MNVQIQTILAATTVLVAGAALADRNINVNGSNTDWNGASTCFTEFQSTSNGVDLNRACITNNTNLGSNGSMFTLFEADLGWYEFLGAGFGFAIDLDGDGTITAANDEVYAVIIPSLATGSKWALNVYAPGSYDRPKRTYGAFAECGGSAGANGWSAARQGSVIEFGISYGCIRFNGTGPALTHGSDNRKVFLGTAPQLHLTNEAYYDGTNDTLHLPGPKPPDVTYPTVTSGNGYARVAWTNGAANVGTLVVRYNGDAWPSSGAFKPADGTNYSVGQTFGGGAYSVVFADRQGQGNSVVDSGLANSNRYSYRVFSHSAGFTYADGQAPTAAGVLATPTSQTNGAPLWCYSTSFPTLNQPAPDGAGGVFSSGNAGILVSMQSSSGEEGWRPYGLGSVMQNRFPIVPLKGKSGRWIISGTQTGSVAAISTATGQPAWERSPSDARGDYIYSAPAVQLAANSNSAFTSRHSGDLIFVATRVDNNNRYRVVALSSVNGAFVWQSDKIPAVSGGMLVDYSQNRLYVPTMDTGPGSLKILSTLNGNTEGTVSVESVSTGVVKDFFWNNNEGQAIVVNDSGIAFGIGLGWTGKSKPSIAWQGPVGGAPSGSPMPLKGGFLVSTKGASGAVKMFAVTAGQAPGEAWSTPIPNPSGPALRISNGYYTEVWVGAESRLYGLAFSTGSVAKQVITDSSRAGVPVIDNTGRIYAGLMDGRICAWNLP